MDRRKKKPKKTSIHNPPKLTIRGTHTHTNTAAKDVWCSLLCVSVPMYWYPTLFECVGCVCVVYMLPSRGCGGWVWMCIRVDKFRGFTHRLVPRIMWCRIARCSRRGKGRIRRTAKPASLQVWVGCWWCAAPHIRRYRTSFGCIAHGASPHRTAISNWDNFCWGRRRRRRGLISGGNVVPVHTATTQLYLKTLRTTHVTLTPTQNRELVCKQISFILMPIWMLFEQH